MGKGLSIWNPSKNWIAAPKGFVTALSALGLLGSSPAAFAQDTIDWINFFGGDWSEGSNWNGGDVPDTIDTARFNNFGDTLTVFLSEDVQVASMQSVPGANTSNGNLNLTLNLQGNDLTTTGLSFLQGSNNDDVAWTFQNTSASAGSLEFQDGFEIGRAARSSNHTLVVTGANTTMEVWTGTRFVVAASGMAEDKEARLEVRDGATVNALNSSGTAPGDLNLGWNSGPGERILQITGPGSSVSVRDLLYRQGTARALVEAGGTLEVTRDIRRVGEITQTAGLEVRDAGSRVSADLLELRQRPWRVSIENGGQLEVDTLYVWGSGVHEIHIHGHASVDSLPQSALIATSEFRTLDNEGSHTDDILRFTLTDPGEITPLILTDWVRWERAVTLEIAADPLFRPSWVEGDEFTLIGFNTHTGNFFAGLNDGDFFTSSDGDLFQVNYNSDSWSLTYIPEPGSSILVGLFGAMLCLLRRRRSRRSQPA